MSPTKGPESPSDRAPAMAAFSGTGALTQAQKGKVIEWYMGEFAVANAIIDALCHHLLQLAGGSGGDGGAPVPEEYETVFAVIHRRRLNWIPVLQMQKYFTIADVALELLKAAARRREKVADDEAEVEEKRRLWKKIVL